MSQRSGGDIEGPIRVLLVQDEGSIAEELRERLLRLGVVTASVAAAPQAISYLGADRPDVILIPIGLAHSEPLDTWAMVCKQFDVPIVYVASHFDRSRSERHAPGPLFGYVLKPLDEHELWNVIEQAIDDHDRQRASRLADGQNSREDAPDATTATLSRYSNLTAREREVFALVVSGRLNKEIAQELHISERTVKAHRARVMKKMEATSVAELTRLAALLGM